MGATRRESAVSARARSTGQRRAASPQARSDASNTKRRVLDAVIACILEKGYYHASSNEIARWAGMTWGVIQYHFGTRERLMLAAMVDQIEKLEVYADSFEFTGSTTEEQLWSTYAFFDGFFGQPEYLASLEITLNLVRTDAISEEMRQQLGRLQTAFDKVMESNPHHTVSSEFASESIRGLVLAHLLRSDATVTVSIDMESAFEGRLSALISAIAWKLNSDSPPKIKA